MSFSLHQFSEIFKIRDAAGQPYILIGGQAVNYWAERYLSNEPELELLQPFTSQDIDFKGIKLFYADILLRLHKKPDGNHIWGK